MNLGSRMLSSQNIKYALILLTAEREKVGNIVIYFLVEKKVIS
jgi:hypothetical protein